ncbi:uncharacterized protein B0I36DRAFT_117430 [Microdochium trichocladiopsis]|uniref:Uncharacterized protein n=1 Tax=Microdochium trichocladiopsis TaxID=1682393 RepID=A0A9P8Y4F5_9PEZI|nr:uncharacterized protein B0I36DRAFT_117430 [Microdochium trichocladiopsis]KAH7030997.1 hypothetical protein B0I36DRAFT_117430 [Microdochium trichocladiopsis]
MLAAPLRLACPHSRPSSPFPIHHFPPGCTPPCTRPSPSRPPSRTHTHTHSLPLFSIPLPSTHHCSVHSPSFLSTAARPRRSYPTQATDTDSARCPQTLLPRHSTSFASSTSSTDSCLLAFVVTVVHSNRRSLLCVRRATGAQFASRHHARTARRDTTLASLWALAHSSRWRRS